MEHQWKPGMSPPLSQVDLAIQEKEKHMNVTRWFDQVQHYTGVRHHLPPVVVLRNRVYTSGHHWVLRLAARMAEGQREEYTGVCWRLNLPNTTVAPSLFCLGDMWLFFPRKPQAKNTRNGEMITKRWMVCFCVSWVLGVCVLSIVVRVNVQG